MSIKYDSKRISLADVIKQTTHNAVYLIPDLQRPYVWSPRQVILLMDSIFKGWPFGSLLLWEVKPECFENDEGIPYRSFWQVVDRTSSDKSSDSSVMAQPSTYYMVLDGQQRVQSLLLALGGDSYGFRLYDHEWASDLRERRMRRNFHRHSKASLCVDVDAFTEELANKSNKVRKLEIGNILDWVILDSKNDISNPNYPGNYEHPLNFASEHPGRYIRFSRLWDCVQSGLSEGEYRDIILPILQEHKVPDADKLQYPFAEFLKNIETIKDSSNIHALQIDSFIPTPQWQKDDYNDAIVNIFTRLNTAGRTLTREEITLAWLKVGWDSASTGGKTAGECLDELRTVLENNELQVSTDELVRLISFVWAVEERDGKLLEAKDLLKGEIVRPMAAAVARKWNQMLHIINEGARLIHKRELCSNAGSFNALIVFLCWFYLSRKWSSTVFMKELDRDSFYKEIMDVGGSFLDRWVFGSQWANVWADGSGKAFRSYASILSVSAEQLHSCNDSNKALGIIKDLSDQLLDRIQDKARDHVLHFSVRDRKKVSQYYSLLWVWHRLDEDRWNYSSIQMRTGRSRTSRLEVDHTVADALWKKLVDSEIESKKSTLTLSEVEEEMLAPDGFESKAEAYSFINFIGNCSLLEKSFNISKSARQMHDFLADVHEFKNNTVSMESWLESMKMGPELVKPNDVEFADLLQAVKDRDQVIKDELSQFIRGDLKRCDLV